MSGKWTPGPWRVVKDSRRVVGVFAGDRDVVSVYGGGVGFEYRDANAHLIAAAPDMADALAYYADHLCEGFCRDLPKAGTYHSGMDLDCCGCRARAALAKARGEA